MKKNYLKPAMRVTKMQTTKLICSTVQSVSGPFTYGGRGRIEGRSRSCDDRDDWDDLDEE